MEAVVFDGQTLKVRYDANYPIPKLVNDTDVIVKVEYSGVCGTDLHIIQGEFPCKKDSPLLLGHEFSGVVSEAGSKSIFKKGQRVVVDPNCACDLCDSCRKGRYHHCTSQKVNTGIFMDGGWAQYCLVPQKQVFALPEGITTEQGGLCEPYSCVAHGFDRASPLLVGEKILIVGAGIIGNLWITTLHHHGHRDVTVSEMNRTRLDIVKKLDTGYRLVTPDVLEKEKETTSYDVIIDCTGVGKVMEISFKYLSSGGKYVLFGCAPQTHQSSLNPFDIYNKEITVIGVKVNPFSFPNAISWLKAMGSRYVDYEKLGVKVYALKDFEQVIADLKAGVVAKAMFKI